MIFYIATGLLLLGALMVNCTNSKAAEAIGRILGALGLLLSFVSLVIALFRFAMEHLP